ncbi:conserved hypothetical protein [Neospora caninum Liverpool]|uniref:Uncharacterized protein n=1 Tax=Neospora caninum (strain Liverpool) TaxID=572307 RepID=F0VCM5_NEOCL|nr:conserved hypothetical protein [Neospora caninum Liverpool]CBZ51714.1 conserved hypothetical protein [Neospora caninum Liverpool]|eukprot:XP_003881747.1 conserved hypothetical protein [Neospora caninum Liverpool]
MSTAARLLAPSTVQDATGFALQFAIKATSTSSSPLPHSLATLTGSITSGFPAQSVFSGTGAGPERNNPQCVSSRQRLHELKELELLQRQEKIQRQLALFQEAQRQRDAAAEKGGLEQETVLLGRNRTTQNSHCRAADLEKKRKQGAAARAPRGGSEAGHSDDPVHDGDCHRPGSASREKESNVRVDIYGDRQPLKAVQDPSHDRRCCAGGRLPLPTRGSGFGESMRGKPGDATQSISPGRAGEEPAHEKREAENLQPRSDAWNRLPSGHFPSLLDSLSEDPLSLSHLCGNTSSLFLSSSSLSLGFLASSRGAPSDAEAGPCLPSSPGAFSPQRPESVFSFSFSPPQTQSTRSPTLLQCEWGATDPQHLSPSLPGRPAGEPPKQAEGKSRTARRSFSCREGLSADAKTDAEGRRRSSSATPGVSSPGAMIFELSARAIDERETPRSEGGRPPSYILPSPQARDICPPHKHLAQQLKLRERKQQERLQRLQRQQLREDARKRLNQARGKCQKAQETSRQKVPVALSGGDVLPTASGTAPRASTAAAAPGRGKETPVPAKGALLSLSAHASAKASVRRLSERASEKHAKAGGLSPSPTREAREESISREATAKSVGPKTGAIRRSLQEGLPHSQAAASLKARHKADFALGEATVIVPLGTPGVASVAANAPRRKSAEGKARKSGIRVPCASHPLHPEATRSEDKKDSRSRGRDDAATALGSGSLTEGTGSARKDCLTGKSREGKVLAAAPPASPIRLCFAQAKVSSTRIGGKGEGKAEAKRERGTALVVCGEGLRRPKGPHAGGKGTIEDRFRAETEDSGRTAQARNASTEDDGDRLRQILQKLRTRLLERQEYRDGRRPSVEVKGGGKRMPVPGDKEGRKPRKVAGLEDRDDVPREDAGQPDYCSRRRTSPISDSGGGGAGKEEQRLTSVAERRQRVRTQPEPIYGEKKVTERPTGHTRRQRREIDEPARSVRTRSSADSRDTWARSATSGESDSSGWSIVERLRRILRVAGKETRNAETGESSTPARQRGRRDSKRGPSVSSSGTSVTATSGSRRRRRGRSGRREARRLLRNALWPEKHETSRLALAERRTSCRPRWRSSSSSVSSDTSSASRRQLSSLSSRASSVSAPASTSSRASPLAASFASSTSSGSSPSLITKWLHYSAALLQSQGSLAGSGSAWASPEQASSRPGAESQRTRRDAGRGRALLSRPERGKETLRAQREDERGATQDKEGVRTGGAHSSSPHRPCGTKISVGRAHVVASPGRTRRAGEKTSYNPLTEDPEEVVRRIKKRLGLPVSPRRDASRPSSVQSSPSHASCSPGGKRRLKREGRNEDATARARRACVRLAEEQEQRRSLGTRNPLSPGSGRSSMLREPSGERRTAGNVRLSGDKGASLRVHSSSNARAFAGKASSGRNGDSQTPSRKWQPLSSLSLSLSSSSLPDSPSRGDDAGAPERRQRGCEDASPIAGRLVEEEKSRGRVRHSGSGLYLSRSASPTREERKGGKARKRKENAEERPQMTRVEIDVSIIRPEEREAPQKTEASPKTSPTRVAGGRLSLPEETRTDLPKDSYQPSLGADSSQLLSFCVSDEDSGEEEHKGTRMLTNPGHSGGRVSCSSPADRGQRNPLEESPSKRGETLPPERLASVSWVSGCDDPHGPLRISALLHSLSQSSGESAAVGGTVSGAQAPQETRIASPRGRGSSESAQHSEDAKPKLEEGDRRDENNWMARTQEGAGEDSARMSDDAGRLQTNALQRECSKDHGSSSPPRGEERDSRASVDHGERASWEGAGDKPPMKTETELSVSFAPILEEKELSKGQACLAKAPETMGPETGELALHASETKAVSILPPAHRSGAPRDESQESRELGSTLSAQLADIQQLQSLLAEAEALERSHVSLLLRDDGGISEETLSGVGRGRGLVSSDRRESREETSEPGNWTVVREAHHGAPQDAPEEKPRLSVHICPADVSRKDGPHPDAPGEGSGGGGPFSSAESAGRGEEESVDEALRERGVERQDRDRRQTGREGGVVLRDQEREHESSRKEDSRLEGQSVAPTFDAAQGQEATRLPVEGNERSATVSTETERCLTERSTCVRLGARESRDIIPVASHERNKQPAEDSKEKEEGTDADEGENARFVLLNLSRSLTPSPSVAPLGRSALAAGREGQERQQSEGELALPNAGSISPAKAPAGCLPSVCAPADENLPLALAEMAMSCVAGREFFSGDRQSDVAPQFAGRSFDARGLGEAGDSTMRQVSAAETACREETTNPIWAPAASVQAERLGELSQPTGEERERHREGEAEGKSGQAPRESEHGDAGGRRGDPQRAASPQSLLPMLTNLLQKQQPLLQSLLEHLQTQQDHGNCGRDEKALETNTVQSCEIPKTSQADSSDAVHRSPGSPWKVSNQACNLQGGGIPHILSLRENTLSLPLGYPPFFVMQSSPSGVCIHLGGTAGESAHRENALFEEQRNHQSGVGQQETELVAALTHHVVRDVSEGTEDCSAESFSDGTHEERPSSCLKKGSEKGSATWRELEEQRQAGLDEGLDEGVQEGMTTQPEALGGQRKRHRVSLDGEHQGQSSSARQYPDESSNAEQRNNANEKAASAEETEVEQLLKCVGVLRTLLSSGVLRKGTTRAMEAGFSEYDDTLQRGTGYYERSAQSPRFSALGDLERGEERYEKAPFPAGGSGSERKGIGRTARRTRGMLRARESSSPRTVERRKWAAEDPLLKREEGCRLGALLEARTENLDRNFVSSLLLPGGTPATDDVEERELMEFIRQVKRSEGRNTHRWIRSGCKSANDGISQDRWKSWGGEEAYHEQRRRLHAFVLRELDGED